jgi:glycosyltransferase involved in cell wall biosynthesis
MVSPFFSIILPTYNRSHLITKAIESVLAQTYASWELVIVDDGSTDNTKETVALFIDPRIHYIYQQNSERSAARNNGMDRAKGQYICFLDSDDYYLNDHLQHLHQAIEASSFVEAVFITDVTRDEDGKLRKVEHEELSLHPNNVCYILSSTETVIPARIAVHAAILKDYRFNSALRVSEDSELLCRIGARYPFIQVPSHTAVYHLHDDNTSHTSNNPFSGQLSALKIIFANPELKPLIPNQIKNEKLAKCYHGIARYYLFKEQYFKMMKMLVRSIVTYPSAQATKAKLYLVIKYLPALLG